jgi:hypothetical protein
METEKQHNLFDSSATEREKRLLLMLERLDDKPAAMKRRVLALAVLLCGDAAVVDIVAQTVSVLRRTTEGG